MPQKTTVFSIVAPGSDYGKTRLITGVVAELSKLGIRACAVKHSAHSPPPDGGKDTHLFRESGALASALVDACGMATVYLPGEGLEGAIGAMAHLDPDVVICEGFKDADIKKVFIARGQEDLAIAGRLSGVVAVASADPLSLPGAAWLRTDAAEVAKFIAGQIQTRGGATR